MKNGYDATKHATMIRMYREERNMPFSATAVGRVDRRARYPGRSRSEAGLVRSACIRAMMRRIRTKPRRRTLRAMNRSVQGRPQSVMSFCINWDQSALAGLVGLRTYQRPNCSSQTRPTGCNASRQPPLLHEELAWDGVRRLCGRSAKGKRWVAH